MSAPYCSQMLRSNLRPSQTPSSHIFLLKENRAKFQISMKKIFKISTFSTSWIHLPVLFTITSSPTVLSPTHRIGSCLHNETNPCHRWQSRKMQTFQKKAWAPSLKAKKWDFKKCLSPQRCTFNMFNLSKDWEGKWIFRETKIKYLLLSTDVNQGRGHDVFSNSPVFRFSWS